MDRRLATNAGWLLVGQIATLGAGLAILVAISRLGTPEDLGRWRFSQAILSYLLVLADAGFTAFAIREIARQASGTPLGKLGQTMLVLRLAVAAISFGATVIALVLSSMSRDTVIVTATMGACAVATALSAGYVLQAREQFRAIAKIRITSQVLAALGVLVSLSTTGSVQGAAFAVLLSTVLAVLMTNRIAGRLGILKGGISASEAARFVRGAAPFIGAGFAVLLIFNADAFLIQLILGERDLGLYAAPYAIAGYSLVIGGALMAAAYPQMARASGRSGSLGHYGELSGVMGTLALPIGIGGMVTAEPLLATLFGGAYAPSWPVLVVLMTLPLVGFLNMTIGQSMAAGGKQRAVFLTAVVSASVNVGLNLIAIPRLGILGAAMVATATECLTLLLYGRLAAGLGVRIPIREYVGSLPAALTMGGAVVALRWAGVESLLLLLPVGVGAYAAIQVVRPSRGAQSLHRVLSPGQGERADPA